jgi:hypothetical protein
VRVLPENSSKLVTVLLFISRLQPFSNTQALRLDSQRRPLRGDVALQAKTRRIDLENIHPSITCCA